MAPDAGGDKHHSCTITFHLLVYTLCVINIDTTYITKYSCRQACNLIRGDVMRDNIVKIEVDHSGEIPRMKAGNYTSKGFFFIGKKAYGNKDESKAWHHPLNEVIGFEGLCLPKTKEVNKELSDKLGLPPALWIKVWNNLAYETYIAPYEKYISAMYWPYVKNVSQVDWFWKHKHLVDQAIADNQENLIPLFVEFGEDAQTIRNRVGKGVWKTLCKNSFHKNLALSRYSPGSVAEIANLSTGVIKMWFTPTVARWVNHLHIKHNCKIKDLSNMHELEDLYNDTRNMAEDLGKPFNNQWSLKRMQEQHDLYSQELLAREYSDEPFKGLPNNVIEHMSCKDTQLTATLLKSPMSLKLEGNAMRHCVASYRDRCENGAYLVYGITDQNGNRVSTLGISIMLDFKCTILPYYLNQHYGFGNNRVNDSVWMFGKYIVDCLNRQAI